MDLKVREWMCIAVLSLLYRNTEGEDWTARYTYLPDLGETGKFIVYSPPRLCCICPPLPEGRQHPDYYFDHACVKDDLLELKIEGSYALCNSRYGKIPGCSVVLQSIHNGFWDCNYGNSSLNMTVYKTCTARCHTGHQLEQGHFSIRCGENLKLNSSQLTANCVRPSTDTSTTSKSSQNVQDSFTKSTASQTVPIIAQISTHLQMNNDSATTPGEVSQSSEAKVEGSWEWWRILTVVVGAVILVIVLLLVYKCCWREKKESHILGPVHISLTQTENSSGYSSGSTQQPSSENNSLAEPEESYPLLSVNGNNNKKEIESTSSTEYPSQVELPAKRNLTEIECAQLKMTNSSGLQSDNRDLTRAGDGALMPPMEPFSYPSLPTLSNEDIDPSSFYVPSLDERGEPVGESHLQTTPTTQSDAAQSINSSTCLSSLVLPSASKLTTSSSNSKDRLQLNSDSPLHHNSEETNSGPAGAIQGTNNGPAGIIQGTNNGPAGAIQGTGIGPNGVIHPAGVIQGTGSGITEVIHPTGVIRGTNNGPAGAIQGTGIGPNGVIPGNDSGPTGVLQGTNIGPTGAIQRTKNRPNGAIQKTENGPAGYGMTSGHSQTGNIVYRQNIPSSPTSNAANSVENKESGVTADECGAGECCKSLSDLREEIHSKVFIEKLDMILFNAEPESCNWKGLCHWLLHDKRQDKTLYLDVCGKQSILKDISPGNGAFSYILNNDLIQHGFHLGHIVFYFSCEHHFRHDVIQHIQHYHQECSFCERFYQNLK